MGQRLRVLDVGMGQGTQALRLARAGHSVTGLESDAEMLRTARESLAGEPEGIRERVRLIEGDGRDTGVHFLPGSFDVVLCHGVLMYVPEPDPLLAGLARMLAPGGLLSLLVRNAGALAMRPGTAGDFAAALAAFDTDTYTNRLGLDVRADRLEVLRATSPGSPPRCTPGTACGSSPTTWATRRSCPAPRSWSGSSPPRTGRGGPIRTAGWPRCCTCAGCAADPAGAVRLIGPAPQAGCGGPWRYSGNGRNPFPQPGTPLPHAPGRRCLRDRAGRRLHRSGPGPGRRPGPAGGGVPGRG